MKRVSISGMVVLVIASAWTILLAQSSPVASSKTFLDPARPPVASAAAPGVASATAPLTPLQQRFIDLATKKARLMTEEQLQQSVNQFDREVEELNAWSKIEESKRLLSDIVDKHPQTPAAEAARSALKVIENRSRPGFSTGRRHEMEKFDPNQLSPFGTESKPSDTRS